MRNFREFLGVVAGALSSNGKRDYNAIYDFPASLAGQNGYLKMYNLANRTGVGARLTYGVSRTSWANSFRLYESDKEDAKQIGEEYENAFKFNKLVKYVEKADVLNRIGRFAILYIGVPDGREPSEEY